MPIPIYIHTSFINHTASSETIGESICEISNVFYRMSLERLLEQNKNKDSGIRVPDNWEDFAYSSDKFAIPEQYKQYIDHVMLPRGLVMDRTEKMGRFFR